MFFINIENLTFGQNPRKISCVKMLYLLHLTAWAFREIKAQARLIYFLHASENLIGPVNCCIQYLSTHQAQKC